MIFDDNIVILYISRIREVCMFIRRSITDVLMLLLFREQLPDLYS